MVKRKKNVTITPRYRIVAMLRKLWLWSPERRAALKRDKQCLTCGSTESLQVHHCVHPDWTHIIEIIQKELLCDVSKLETHCKDCHAALTKAQREYAKSKES